MIPRRHLLIGAVACFTVAAILLWSLAAFAVDYTVSLTASQDAALDDIVSGINAERAARIPPASAITKAQYMQNLVSDQAVEWRRQRAREVIESITTWSGMTAGQKTKFCNAVNLSPCPQ
jgi:hypothetical protein